MHTLLGKVALTVPGITANVRHLKTANGFVTHKSDAKLY